MPNDSEGKTIKKVKVINPTSNASMEALLTDLKGFLDEVESKLENIKIEADSINLNTDELEGKIDGLKGSVDAVNLKIPADPARENGNLAGIKFNTDNLDSTLSSRATEGTLHGIKTGTDKIPSSPATENGNLEDIKINTEKLDANLSTRATEATLQSVKNKTDNLDIPLSDLAKESTLLSLLSSVAGNLWQKLSLEGKGFTSLTGFTTIGTTAETDFMLLKNPSGSSKLVRLKEFIFTIGANSTQKSIFRLYRNPTITSNGSALSVYKVLSTGGYSTIMETYEAPTISNRGTLIAIFEVDFNSYVRDQDLSRFIPDGANLLITVQSGNNGIEHNITATWAEV